MTDDQFAEELKRVAARLSEHCDAVQISACRNDAGNTSCFHMGEGNWYARMGMAKEFIELDAERVRIRARNGG